MLYNYFFSFGEREQRLIGFAENESKKLPEPISPMPADEDVVLLPTGEKEMPVADRPETLSQEKTRDEIAELRLELKEQRDLLQKQQECIMQLSQVICRHQAYPQQNEQGNYGAPAFTNHPMIRLRPAPRSNNRNWTPFHGRINRRTESWNRQNRDPVRYVRDDCGACAGFRREAYGYQPCDPSIMEGRTRSRYDRATRSMYRETYVAGSGWVRDSTYQPKNITQIREEAERGVAASRERRLAADPVARRLYEQRERWAKWQQQAGGRLTNVDINDRERSHQEYADRQTRLRSVNPVLADYNDWQQGERLENERKLNQRQDDVLRDRPNAQRAANNERRVSFQNVVDAIRKSGISPDQLRTDQDLKTVEIGRDFRVTLTPLGEYNEETKQYEPTAYNIVDRRPDPDNLNTTSSVYRGLRNPEEVVAKLSELQTLQVASAAPLSVPSAESTKPSSKVPPRRPLADMAKDALEEIEKLQ